MSTHEYWRYKIVLQCEEKSHDIVVRVEKHYDSMRADSDFYLECENPEATLLLVSDADEIFDPPIEIRTTEGD